MFFSNCRNHKGFMSNNLHPVLAVQSEKIDTFMDISIKAMEGFGQFMELNVAAVKASLEESQGVMQSMSSAKSSQELWAMQSEWVKPMPDRISAYCRQCYAILQSSNAEITSKLGMQSSQSQKTWAALFDGLAKSAPVTSEAAAALVKSAVGMANNAFESVQKAVLHNGHDHGAEQGMAESQMANRGRSGQSPSPRSRG